jgi:hypothetical protein
MVEGLSHPYVLSISIDNARNVWVGTKGGGLDWLKGDHAFHLDTINGMVDYTIFSVLDDGRDFYGWALPAVSSAYNGSNLKNWRNRSGRRWITSCWARLTACPAASVLESLSHTLPGRRMAACGLPPPKAWFIPIPKGRFLRPLSRRS